MARGSTGTVSSEQDADRTGDLETPAGQNASQ